MSHSKTGTLVGNFLAGVWGGEGCCRVSIGNEVPRPLLWLLHGGGGGHPISLPSPRQRERPSGTGVGEEFQEKVYRWSLSGGGGLQKAGLGELQAKRRARGQGPCVWDPPYGRELGRSSDF